MHLILKIDLYCNIFVYHMLYYKPFNIRHDHINCRAEFVLFRGLFSQLFFGWF